LTIAGLAASPSYEQSHSSFIDATLPREARDWTFGEEKSYGEENGDLNALLAALDQLRQTGSWQWPRRPILFLSDLHADSDAFLGSLAASGAIRLAGSSTGNYHLTDLGRYATLVIGGDCFDKGPSNLALLTEIKSLLDCGVDIRILAGNHDIRTYLGMRAPSFAADHRNNHFFLRLGPKVIPLLKEIWDGYLAGKSGLRDVPDAATCRRYLFPEKDWVHEFPACARPVLSETKIARELKRIEKKTTMFEPSCAAVGLSIRHVYAAVQKWRQLFLDRDGEFAWFFQNMQLGYREGSLIFVHAGFDDAMAQAMRDRGADEINRMFRAALSGEPFDLYYGSIANTIRTKYRKVDNDLSARGAEHIRQSGIHAIIHGHRNQLHGQRMMLRKGVINFECDATVDSHSRHKEGLRGPGAAVTVVQPEGRILGISTDFPYIKVFEPKQTADALEVALGLDKRMGDGGFVRNEAVQPCVSAGCAVDQGYTKVTYE
tara:strand:- start:1748 stop:3211 length:1464 start_codon:yes stop_codon:yes gene_type:complete